MAASAFLKYCLNVSWKKSSISGNTLSTSGPVASATFSESHSSPSCSKAILRSSASSALEAAIFSLA